MRPVFLAYPQPESCTEYLQKLIDECAASGGGQVRLTAGVYQIATLYLKSHVELYLDAGVNLQGSSNHEDYSNQCDNHVVLADKPWWYDAMIAAVHQTDVTISGEGVIDGVDCYNPNGEQDFRGPHSVQFLDCSDVKVQGITIVRSACYNLIFERCENVTVSHVCIRGGQDGFRFGNCRHVLVDHCDVRSGDDCIGGSGNEDITIADCMLNTPGSATLMLICRGLRMKRCKIWSPCEYPAIFCTDKRYSLCGTALVSGYDYGYEWEGFSSDWHIEDTVFENGCGVFLYDTLLHGRPSVPITDITLERVRAVNMVDPIIAKCREDVPMRIVIRDSSFSFAREDENCDGTFLRAENFYSVELDNVQLHNCNEHPIQCRNGQSVLAKDVVIRHDLTSSGLCAEGVKSAQVQTTPTPLLHSRIAVENTTSKYYPKEATEEFRGALPFIPSKTF